MLGYPANQIQRGRTDIISLDDATQVQQVAEFAEGGRIMQQKGDYATVLDSYNYLSDPFALCSLVEGVAYTWTPTSTALLVLTAVTLVLTYLWVTRLWRSSFDCTRDPGCPLPLPPGTMGYPFIGETFQFARKREKFFSERLSRYGPVYKTHLLGCPTVRVVGKENIKPVLLGEHSFVRSHWPWSVRTLLGQRSLTGMASDEHRFVKKQLVSLFSPTAMASFVPRIQAVIDLHLDRWCQESERRGQMLGFPACRQLSLDLGMEIILGVGLDRPDRDSLRAAFREIVTNMFSLPIVFPGSGVWKGLRARERILREVRQKLDTTETRIKDGDFLSLLELMQLSPELGDQRRLIEDMTIELIFAGYSTINSVFCNTLLCLGRNPDVVQKVEAELREEGLLDDPTAELTGDVIGRLQYVRDVSSEVLRLYPPAGAGFRKVLKTLKIGDYQIPEGWTVAYSIRETQQTSGLFHDSERFLPERWQQQQEEKLGNHNQHHQRRDVNEKLRYQYLPFGMAGRACVGRKLAKLYQDVFVAELVRRCRFQLRNPGARVTFIPIPKPVDDLPVVFQRRVGHSLKPS